MRRVLAPLGGAISFIIVALLVIGGLTWVTIESLHVESEQRLAKARAEAAQQERLALWRLDSRLFPAWGVENNRSYAHYFAFYTPYPVVCDDTVGANGEPLRVPSPLLTAELPDWMKLHFQLDPELGWDSPQVMSNEGEAKLREQLMVVFDIAPENVNGIRSATLANLRANFPVKAIHEQLLRLETMNPDDSPLAVPYLFEPSPPKVMAPPPLQAPGGFTGNTLPPAMPQPKPMEVKPAPERITPGTPGAAAAPEQQSPPNDPANNKTQTAAGGRGEPGYEARRDAGKKVLDETRGGNLTIANNAGSLLPPEPKSKIEELAKLEAKKLAAPVVLTPEPEADKSPVRAKDDPQAKPQAKTESRKLNYSHVKPPTVQVGPMRPVWLTAPNGQAVLVLVRVARLETKVVFQGVLLDWPRLQAVLTEEIHQQLPQAKLEAVRDATPNERLMTALPAMLEPGPELVPPPAGWTPLRIGLTLGWVAALLALAAVGFVGWTLIDLSERRIRFVSAVTHELRTPLTALRLYTDLLASGMIADEDKQKDYLRTIGHESERLNTLIENVLDFAKLEKRTVQAHCVPVGIGDLLEQVKLVWADRLANEGREFVVVSTLPAEQCVTTDARIAAQILGNLIDNARKYSREASEKRIWLWARPGEKNGIIFEVEDRGPGVPPSESSTIFRPFRRGQNVSATGGAGLGLALARQWSDLLGGTLTYRPADGGLGACFRLELPASC